VDMLGMCSRRGCTGGRWQMMELGVEVPRPQQLGAPIGDSTAAPACTWDARDYVRTLGYRADACGVAKSSRPRCGHPSWTLRLFPLHILRARCCCAVHHRHHRHQTADPCRGPAPQSTPCLSHSPQRDVRDRQHERYTHPPAVAAHPSRISAQHIHSMRPQYR
jgi:hypothetical protein